MSGPAPGTWSHAARRRVVVLLLAAYLPSLLFLGHWDLQIDIPGTNYYVGLPVRPHNHPDDGEGHGEHCHTDMGDCARTPLAATAPVFLIAAALEGEAYQAHGILVPAALWAPHGPEAISPEPPPPRAA